MIYEIKDGSIVSGLFAGWEETIIWSCLQGIMGKLYGNHPRFPTAAMALLGDFAFLAGTPDPELAAYKPGWCTQRFIIWFPGTRNGRTVFCGTTGKGQMWYPAMPSKKNRIYLKKRNCKKQFLFSRQNMSFA